jgi:hypothetical protein
LPRRTRGCWLPRAGTGPPARAEVGKRRRLETVISQLVGATTPNGSRARDGWHLWSRRQGKQLATIAVSLGQQQGLGPLRFADLVTDWNPHTGLLCDLMAVARQLGLPSLWASP